MSSIGRMFFYSAFLEGGENVNVNDVIAFCLYLYVHQKQLENLFKWLVHLKIAHDLILMIFAHVLFIFLPS